MTESLKRKAPKDAHTFTVATNKTLSETLRFEDRRDFTDARRGLIGTIPHGLIKDDHGNTVWDLREYDFLLEAEVPETVNPSLWRQAQLNMIHGLFAVTDRVYQIRGYDLANMTIIEGDNGLIVFDTLTTTQAASAAIELYYQHRPKRPIVAVIYSHSHIDHYGGVKGIISQEDVDSGRVEVIAPNGFMEAVGDEGVHSSNASSRRAQYQFGVALKRGPRGQVDAGLGKNVSRGTFSLIAPTRLIIDDTETLVIDGVEMLFQMAPESEAPAEMHMYLPQFKVLNLAENAVHNLHNLLPLRGTVVRDSRLWARYIDKAIGLYGETCEILIGQHHWPIWGRKEVIRFLEGQRDLYKHVHDQTLRLMNHGLKPAETAEEIACPPGLQQEWGLREYYGTIRHNTKAISQRYLGWYDGNPANLNPLPPDEAAKRMVRYMGGANKLLAKAREDFDAGEFRWVAQVASQLVFAEPDNQEARFLAADAFEQLGYQAESATWRNAYLFGAQELREGILHLGQRPRLGPDIMEAIGIETLFDYLAIRLNPEKAGDREFRSIWRFTGSDERIALTLRNQTLTYREAHEDDTSIAAVELDRKTFANLIIGDHDFDALIASGELKVEGDKSSITDLFHMLDAFEYMFNIVTPRAG